MEVSPESKKAIKKLRAIIRKGIHNWTPEVTAQEFIQHRFDTEVQARLLAEDSVSNIIRELESGEVREAA